ncbi:MAG: NAD(P)-dependent oxidoreductase [SAR324 cluster bacterium]|nr:NAD(P)-dependent oxidoreductase [SAR324 cluster bacterium]
MSAKSAQISRDDFWPWRASRGYGAPEADFARRNLALQHLPAPGQSGADAGTTALRRRNNQGGQVMKEILGFLGMGTMGAPMARNLLKAGYPVVVYNRSRHKAEALADAGAQVADSVAQVAMRAQVVLACLADAQVVEQVVTGPGGLLQAMEPGKVFVDMTTNSPPVSIRLARLCAEKGVEMLDAPVSGGDVGAAEGKLSIMLGGKPEVFQRCLPILEVLGRRITHMGGQVGAGGYAKLANQIMVPLHLVAMSEALVFGAKAGLDLNKLASALSGGMANSAIFEYRASKMLAGDFAPGGTAAVQLKDLNYISQAMDALGMSLPCTELVRSLYQRLVDEGHGKEDHSSIVRIFEQAAGVLARGKV